MTDKELLEKTAERLRKIAEDTQRITTGNMSHNLMCLRGFALRAAESIERHLQEEPVNEDLEEAAYQNCIDRLSKESIEDFKAGAKWKEKQMQPTIELAEEHAMLAGMNKMEQQILKNSFEATVCKYLNTYLEETDKDAVSRALKEYTNGGRVRVAIIKQE